MDSYKTMLQRTARKVYELRIEADQAEKELRAASKRHEDLAKQVRDYEGQLCQAVGANQDKKLWRVDTTISVLAEYHNNTCSTVSIIYDQESE